MSRHNLLRDYQVLSYYRIHLACSDSQVPPIPHPTSPPRPPLHHSLVASLMRLPHPIFLSMTFSCFIVLFLAPAQPWTRKCIMYNSLSLSDHLTSCHVSQFHPLCLTYPHKVRGILTDSLRSTEKYPWEGRGDGTAFSCTVFLVLLVQALSNTHSSILHVTACSQFISLS